MVGSRSSDIKIVAGKVLVRATFVVNYHEEYYHGIVRLFAVLHLVVRNLPLPSFRLYSPYRSTSQEKVVNAGTAVNRY